MKKLLKLTKAKIFGIFAFLAILIPIFAMANLSPVLDSQNLYRIANRSNSATWGTSTTADPGQTLSFLVHIHNNVLETTANNIRVQAVISSGEVTSYTSSAHVQANNASPVSGTTSYTFSSPAVLEYIPGTTVLYNHLNQVEKNLPDGITTGGIDLGLNLQGCWEYEKWIIFQAKVVAPINPTLYYCSTETGCANTKQYKTTSACQVGTGKPCYTSDNECKGTAGKYCALPTPTPTPTPPQPQIPVSLPATGPAEAAAGVFGTIGLTGATAAWVKSKRKLFNAKRK